MNETTAPRRTQAERSEAMRARLSAEAYRLIAAGGLRSLTIRSLAVAAGVSQGAVLHHFPDKNAIVLMAIEQTLTLARDDSAQWLESNQANAAEVLRAMLAEFRAFFYSDRFWVAISITLEASKDEDLFPAVRTLVSELRTPIYAAWQERLQAHGWDHDAARRDVRGGAAMISGAAIRRLWADDDAVSEAVVNDWLAVRLARINPR